MSRWRVSTGRSVGSSGPPPSWWRTLRARDQPDVVLEVLPVAGPPAAVQVRHERRPADGGEHQAAPAEHDVARRVPGVEGERRRARSRSAPRPGPDPAGRVASRRSTVAPAAASRSIARSPRTSTPTSARIRSEARWIVLDLVGRQDLERRERVGQRPERELRDAAAGTRRVSPTGRLRGHVGPEMADSAAATRRSAASATWSRVTSRWVTARIVRVAERDHEHAGLAGAGDDRRGVGRAVRGPEHEDVRLDGRRVEHRTPATRAEPIGEEPGVRVVLGQAVEVVVEGVVGGRGEDADLAHRAAGHPPVADRGVDERRAIRRASSRRARRAPSRTRRDDVERRAPARPAASPSAAAAFQRRAPSRNVASRGRARRRRSPGSRHVARRRRRPGCACSRRRRASSAAGACGRAASAPRGRRRRVNRPPPGPISVNWTPLVRRRRPGLVPERRGPREPTRTSSPGRVRVRIATWLAIVPVGNQSAASCRAARRRAPGAG